ncbi:MAG: CYTH domain-containing protein [Gammaproteobacteria bacterium]|nr:CYTH domain-containing protein [Gammaproteobacteria bacterium]
MAREIERKFLLLNDHWRALVSASIPMRQGYLSTTGAVSVRVRLEGARACLNLKGARLGISREEFEFPLPPAEAAEVLDLFCGERCVEKIRHLVPNGPHGWEIDEFSGANQGLIVAEIELGAEDEDFIRPSWLGREVSDEARYYNVCLIDAPYTSWPDRGA